MKNILTAHQDPLFSLFLIVAFFPFVSIAPVSFLLVSTTWLFLLLFFFPLSQKYIFHHMKNMLPTHRRSHFPLSSSSFFHSIAEASSVLLISTTWFFFFFLSLLSFFALATPSIGGWLRRHRNCLRHVVRWPQLPWVQLRVPRVFKFTS